MAWPITCTFHARARTTKSAPRRLDVAARLKSFDEKRFGVRKQFHSQAGISDEFADADGQLIDAELLRRMVSDAILRPAGEPLADALVLRLAKIENPIRFRMTECV